MTETVDIRPRWRQPDALALAVLGALTLLMFWHRFVFDNWLARHDLLTFFLPWFGALGDRLRDLDIPALNPSIFSGAPFAGDPESGWMFLPAMLFFPFFEVTLAYKLMILLLLVIAGTSTYALARVLGYGVLAALVSAVAFEFGPYLFGQTDCCTVGTNVLAFLPLAFLGVELALRARTWSLRAGAWVLGGFAISQMLAAWLGQGAVNALLVVAAWVAFRTLVTPPDAALDVRGRLVALVTTGPAVLGIGLLLGAAGLLPRLQANGESNNAGGTYEHTPGAADAPFHTLTSILKTLLVDSLAYRGSALWGFVLILGLLGILLMRRRSAVPFFAVVALVIPMLAMGVPVITDLFYLIPLYKEMHIHSPGRVLWLNPFFPAMLAGAGVQELGRLRLMRHGWLVALVPLALVLVASWRVEASGVDVGMWTYATAIIATLLVLVVALAPRTLPHVAQRRVLQGVGVALVALTFLLPNGLDIWTSLTRDDPPPGELVMWGNDAYMQNIIHESLRRDDPGGAGEFLQAQQASQPPFRFIAYGGMYHPETVYKTYPDRRLEPGMIAILQNARPMRLGLETTQGYNPVQPLVYQDFIAALNRREQNYHYANLLNTGVNSPLLDLLNVRYIVVDRTIPESRDDIRALAEIRTEVFRNDQVIIFESPTVRPRAWMVYDVRPEDNGQGLAQLASGGVNGADVAFVNGALPPVAAPPAGSAPRVTVTRAEPDSLTMRVTHDGVGLLVVSEIYSANWKATVDGKDVDVIQTDHALLGIPVGPGEHTVVVRYAPTTLTVGLWASGLASVGALIALGNMLWQGTRKRNHLSRILA
ncbi:MAG TPA: YfhO family protein [Thermomicrobiales bacterium]|nr:YfhO family protein [Thermomicrobiales bacterium]